jgi:hypothetical protein
MRHTFASQLLQAGAAITYVSKQMGHSDTSITLKVYAHWLPDATRRDVDLLDMPAASDASRRIPTASSDLEEGLDESAEPLISGEFAKDFSGEPPRNRTENPQIKSLLLCQLS